MAITAEINATPEQWLAFAKALKDAATGVSEYERVRQIAAVIESTAEAWGTNATSLLGQASQAGTKGEAAEILHAVFRNTSGKLVNEVLLSSAVETGTVSSGIEVAATGEAVGSGGLAGQFARLGSWATRGWLAASSKIAALLGGIIVVGALAGITYVGANYFGGRSADPSVAPGPSTTRGFDTSGEWRLSWTWTVTTVAFEGHLSGIPGKYSFQGHYVGGGNYVWRPDDGSVQCLLSGDPEHSSHAGHASCRASFADGGKWTAETDGSFSVFGKPKRFEYRGSGVGSSPTDKAARVEEIKIRPKG